MLRIAAGVLLGLLGFVLVMRVGLLRLGLPALALILLASGNELVGGLLAASLALFWASYAVAALNIKWRERRERA
jgi:hypothetical protein